MQKRGQLAIFVILAIVIAGVIFLVYYLSKDISRSKGAEGQDLLDEIAIQSEKVLQGCLDDSLGYSVYYLFAHGGKIDRNNSIDVSEIGFVHKGFDIISGKITFPTNNEVQEQIANLVESKIESCFNVSDFEGGVINADKSPEAIVKINQKDVIAYLDYPLNFNFAESSSRFTKTLTTKIPLNLTTILDSARGLLKTIEEDSESLDLHYIQETPIEITIIPLETDALVFILTDKKEINEGIPITLIFTMA